jgi:energy-coupling factor transporter ATP-binding protein EcfA2
MIKNRTGEQWQAIFMKNCLSKPGEHIGIYGTTGGGKTTLMFWICEGLRMATDETIVWFDIGKVSEAATLLTFGPVRFIVPKDMKFELTPGKDFGGGQRIDGEPFKVYPYEIVYIEDPADPWMSIKKGWINIVCLYPYIIDPQIYAEAISKTFNKLIRYAHYEQLISPMSIFLDEMHLIAAGSTHGLSGKHYNAGAILQLNIDKLRAMGVRIVGSSQGITKLRKGVRSAFSWIIIKRGAIFLPDDELKLHHFNPKWQTLEPYQFVIVEPTRRYSDIMEIAYYPKGIDIAHLRYLSELEDLQAPAKLNDEGLAGDVHA